MPENHIPSKADIRGLRIAIVGDPETGQEGLIEVVERLARKDRNNRVVIALAVVLIVVVAGFASYFYSELHDNAVTACQGGNERNQAEREFWEDLVIGSDAETQEEQKILRRLDQQAKAVYAPRDCDNLDQQYQAPERMGDITP